MKNRISLVIIMSMMVVSTSAQSLWTSVEGKVKVVKGLNAYVEGENRTANGFGGAERWAASVGLDCKVLPWLKLSAGYTYIYQYTESRTTKKGNVISGYWQPRHRASFAIVGSYNWNRFTFSLRERYQYTHRSDKNVAKYDGDDGSQKEDEYIEAKNKQVLRSRLEVDYSIRKSGFTPFVSAELYNDIDNSMAKDKLRWTVGTEYKINKQHSVNLFYRYIDKVDDDDSNNHVIGVGYQLRF